MGNFFGSGTSCEKEHEKPKEKEPKEPKRPSVIYLDYNATTPLEKSVLSSIQDALQNAWANPSSTYKAGKEAMDIIQNSRVSLAKMIGAYQNDIIFVSGGTEANNWVFHSAVEYYKNATKTSADQKLPHVVTTNLEHDSIIVTAKKLKEMGIIDLTIVKVSTKTGKIEVLDLVECIKPSTCLVTVMLANNEIGVIQPIVEISNLVKALNDSRMAAGIPKVLLHTDAAQAIGKIKVDVKELGVDFMTIVGHKFYGPRIGALYVNGPNVSTQLYPMFYGGGQERAFRPGTENTGMIAGLGEAAELIIKNLDEYNQHMTKVRDYLETKLSKTFGDQVCFNGKSDGTDRLPNTCNVSFLGKGLQGWKILSKLKKTQASVGAACHSDQQSKPSSILLALDIPESIAENAVRLSVGRETLVEDIDVVVEDFKNAINELKKESE